MRRLIQICNGLDNVGDRLAPLITSALFDVEVIKVLAHVPEQYAGIPVLAGLGSCLGYYGDWPLRVWGTGYEPGYMDRVARSYSGTRPLWKVYAVRGYITRTILKLDSDVVIAIFSIAKMIKRLTLTLTSCLHIWTRFKRLISFAQAGLCSQRHFTLPSLHMRIASHGRGV